MLDMGWLNPRVISKIVLFLAVMETGELREFVEMKGHRGQTWDYIFLDFCGF